MQNTYTKVIADLCGNHGGDLNRLKKMIKDASRCNINIIKIQSFQAKKLIRGDKTLYEILELSNEDHFEIFDYCEDQEIGFLCTCFDIDRVDFLASVSPKMVKVASPDLTSYKMIDKLMDKFDLVIISTASGTDKEIEETMRRYPDAKFLHCNPYYPTDPNHVNMRKMLKFNMHGFSDHTLGTNAAKMAISLGAKYLEKHFTLDRFSSGPDQMISGSLSEFFDICSFRDDISSMSYSYQTINQEYRDKYIGRWGNNA